MENMMDENSNSNFASLDLYDDLITDEGLRRQENYDEISKKYDAAVERITELECEVETLKKSESNMTEKCSILERNISTLFLTARLELERKDKNISQLKQMLRQRNLRNPTANTDQDYGQCHKPYNGKRRLSSDDGKEKTCKRSKISGANNTNSMSNTNCAQVKTVSTTGNSGQSAAKKILNKSMKDLQLRASGKRRSQSDTSSEKLGAETLNKQCRDNSSSDTKREKYKESNRSNGKDSATDVTKRTQTDRCSKHYSSGQSQHDGAKNVSVQVQREQDRFTREQKDQCKLKERQDSKRDRVERGGNRVQREHTDRVDRKDRDQSKHKETQDSKRDRVESWRKDKVDKCKKDEHVELTRGKSRTVRDVKLTPIDRSSKYNSSTAQGKHDSAENISGRVQHEHKDRVARECKDQGKHRERQDSKRDRGESGRKDQVGKCKKDEHLELTLAKGRTVMDHKEMKSAASDGIGDLRKKLEKLRKEKTSADDSSDSKDVHNVPRQNSVKDRKISSVDTSRMDLSECFSSPKDQKSSDRHESRSKNKSSKDILSTGSKSVVIETDDGHRRRDGGKDKYSPVSEGNLDSEHPNYSPNRKTQEDGNVHHNAIARKESNSTESEKTCVNQNLDSDGSSSLLRKASPVSLKMSSSETERSSVNQILDSDSLSSSLVMKASPVSLKMSSSETEGSSVNQILDSDSLSSSLVMKASPVSLKMSSSETEGSSVNQILDSDSLSSSLVMKASSVSLKMSSSEKCENMSSSCSGDLESGMNETLLMKRPSPNKVSRSPEKIRDGRENISSKLKSPESTIKSKSMRTLQDDRDIENISNASDINMDVDRTTDMVSATTVESGHDSANICDEVQKNSEHVEYESSETKTTGLSTDSRPCISPKQKPAKHHNNIHSTSKCRQEQSDHLSVVERTYRKSGDTSVPVSKPQMNHETIFDIQNSSKEPCHSKTEDPKDVLPGVNSVCSEMQEAEHFVCKTGEIVVNISETSVAERGTEEICSVVEASTRARHHSEGETTREEKQCRNTDSLCELKLTSVVVKKDQDRVETDDKIAEIQTDMPKDKGVCRRRRRQSEDFKVDEANIDKGDSSGKCEAPVYQQLEKKYVNLNIPEDCLQRDGNTQFSSGEIEMLKKSVLREPFFDKQCPGKGEDSVKVTNDVVANVNAHQGKLEGQVRTLPLGLKDGQNIHNTVLKSEMIRGDTHVIDMAALEVSPGSKENTVSLTGEFSVKQHDKKSKSLHAKTSKSYQELLHTTDMDVNGSSHLSDWYKPIKMETNLEKDMEQKLSPTQIKIDQVVVPSNSHLSSVYKVTVDQRRVDNENCLETKEKTQQCEPTSELSATQQCEPTSELSATQQCEPTSELSATQQCEPTSELSATQQCEPTSELSATQQCEPTSELSATQQCEPTSELSATQQCEPTSELSATQQCEPTSELSAEDDLNAKCETETNVLISEFRTTGDCDHRKESQDEKANINSLNVSLDEESTTCTSAVDTGNRQNLRIVYVGEAHIYETEKTLNTGGTDVTENAARETEQESSLLSEGTSFESDLEVSSDSEQESDTDGENSNSSQYESVQETSVSVHEGDYAMCTGQEFQGNVPHLSQLDCNKEACKRVEDNMTDTLKQTGPCSPEQAGLCSSKPTVEILLEPTLAEVRHSKRNNDDEEELDYEYDLDSSNETLKERNVDFSDRQCDHIAAQNSTGNYSHMDTATEDFQEEEFMICISPSESMEFDTADTEENDKKVLKGVNKEQRTEKTKVQYSRSDVQEGVPKTSKRENDDSRHSKESFSKMGNNRERKHRSESKVYERDSKISRENDSDRSNRKDSDMRRHHEYNGRKPANSPSHDKHKHDNKRTQKDGHREDKTKEHHQSGRTSMEQQYDRTSKDRNSRERRSDRTSEERKDSWTPKEHQSDRMSKECQNSRTPKERQSGRTSKEQQSDRPTIEHHRRRQMSREEQSVQTSKERQSDRMSKDCHSDRTVKECRKSNENLHERETLKGSSNRNTDHISKNRTPNERNKDRTSVECVREHLSDGNRLHEDGSRRNEHRTSSERGNSSSPCPDVTSHKKHARRSSTRNLENRYDDNKIIRTVTSETIHFKDITYEEGTMELFNGQRPTSSDADEVQTVDTCEKGTENRNELNQKSTVMCQEQIPEMEEIGSLINVPKGFPTIADVTGTDCVNITRTASDDEAMEIRVTDSSSSSIDSFLSDVSEPDKCARIRTWQEVAKIFRVNPGFLNNEPVVCVEYVEEKQTELCDGETSDEAGYSSDSRSSNSSKNEDGNNEHALNTSKTFEICDNSDEIPAEDECERPSSGRHSGYKQTENIDEDNVPRNSAEIYDDNANDNFSDNLSGCERTSPVNIPLECVINEESLEEGEILTDSEGTNSEMPKDKKSTELHFHKTEVKTKSEVCSSHRSVGHPHRYGNSSKDTDRYKRSVLSPMPSPSKGKSSRDEVYRRKHVQSAVKVLRDRSRERRSNSLSSKSPVKKCVSSSSRDYDRTDLRGRLGKREERLPSRKRKRSRSFERRSRIKHVSPRRS